MAELSEEIRHCYPEEGPITAYLEWASRTSHTPPEAHLASVLPVVGFELCRRGYRLHDGSTPHAWFAVIAGPGTGKTTALTMARKFSTSFYGEVFHQDLAPKPWVSLAGSMSGVLQHLGGLANESGITPAVLHHTEVSEVFRNREAYEPLCRLYDNEPIERNLRYLQQAIAQGDTAAKQASNIERPAISAIVTTTPSFSNQIQAEMLTGGLLSRFLWLRLVLRTKEMQPEFQFDREGRAWALSWWKHWFGLLDQQRRSGGSLEIAYAGVARKFFNDQFFEQIRTLVDDGQGYSREDYIGGVCHRMLSHARRIATLYAGSRAAFHKGQIMVDLDDAIRAANLVSRCMKDTITLSAPVAVDAMRLDEREMLLMTALRRAGERGMTRRDVYGIFNNRVDKGALGLLIQTLVDKESIVEYAVPTGRPGRPSTRLYAAEAWSRVAEKAGISTMN